jgi:hypothetical protein
VQKKFWFHFCVHAVTRKCAIRHGCCHNHESEQTVHRLGGLEGRNEVHPGSYLHGPLPAWQNSQYSEKVCSEIGRNKGYGPFDCAQLLVFSYSDTCSDAQTLTALVYAHIDVFVLPL